MLGEVHPSEMVNNSDKLFKAYLGELKGQVKTSYPIFIWKSDLICMYRSSKINGFQMKSTTKEPKLPVVAGCLKGITALMVNFTKSMEEGGHDRGRFTVLN